MRKLTALSVLVTLLVFPYLWNSIMLIREIGYYVLPPKFSEVLVDKSEKWPTLDLTNPKYLTKQEFTYNAMIRLTDSENEDTFCSGTVVSDDYAITAAHCVVQEGNRLNYFKLRKNIRIFSIKRENTGVTANAIAAIHMRGDVALLKGDFRKFEQIKLDVSPFAILSNGNAPFLSCGYPRNGDLACIVVGQPAPDLFLIFMKGQLFPGMSGGGVISLGNGCLVGANSAVASGGILIAPLTGLFDEAGIKVIK